LIQNGSLKFGRLYSHGYDDGLEDWVTLGLLYVGGSSNSVSARLRVSILDNNRREFKSIWSNEPVQFLAGTCVGLKKFMLRDDLFKEENGLLLNGQLTIFCKLEFASSETTNCLLQSSKFDVPSERLSEDFAGLWKSKRFADVTILVDDKEFPAHKAVLAARSPVFLEIFENQAKNKEGDESKSTLKITDVNKDVFEKMLSFIYTGKAGDLENVAGDLLVAAGSYGLEALKNVCEQVLANNITVQNAAGFLIFADTHLALNLKNHVLHFICK